MIPLQITWILLRELVRAIASPFRLLLHLPGHRRWQERTKTLLDPAATVHDVPQLLTAQGSKGHVFLSAGETSGESHAIGLMRAVAEAGGTARWSCFGGARMADAGGTLLYPLSDRAIMGIAGALTALPFLVKAVARFLRLLRDDPPDLVVLVDNPGLHLVLAEAARKRGIPVLHYVAPQYWAWGPWRMSRYRKAVNATLAILPFEPAFFARQAIPCEYIGHPLLDHQARQNRSGWPELDAPTLCILPGSRSKEIRMNLPGLLRTARKLKEQHADLNIVLPHSDPRRNVLIQEILGEHGAGPELVRLEIGPIDPWIAQARVVIAKSGTGAFEPCLYGTPTVIVYRMHGRISHFFYKRAITSPFIGLANLIAARRIVPEFCFIDDALWEGEIFEAAQSLLQDGTERQRCLDDLRELQDKLGKPGAGARAARWVLPFCETNS